MSLGESARPGARRLVGTAAALLVWVWASGVLQAGPTCPAPVNLKVCQDAYSQPRGRVFLLWDNRGSYVCHYIFVDGRLEAVVPGTSHCWSISGLESRTYQVSIQSICGSGMESVFTSQPITVLDRTPYEDPVRSVACGFGDEGFFAELTGLSGPFEFVDVYEQKIGGSPVWIGCQPLGGSSDQILAVPKVDHTASRVYLQFFDEECHGSVSVECFGPATPPEGLEVLQKSYGKKAGAVVCWIRAGGQKGFQILVDGKEVGVVGAMVDTYYIEDLAPGEHRFEVRTRPWEGAADPGPIVTATIREEPPTWSPVRSISTGFMPLDMPGCEAISGKILVKWENTGPVRSVDLLLRRGGGPLRYLSTVEGEPAEVVVFDALENDEILLQCFDGAGFGSQVMGDTSFRRGDPNDDGGVDLSDGVAVLEFLFSGREAFTCLDAADTNDDAAVDISDGLTILNFLFLGDEEPPPPGPFQCGQDPTRDDLALCQENCP